MFCKLANASYMKLKRDCLIKAAQPTRVVKQLDRVVQSYKPVSDHKHNVTTTIIPSNFLGASCNITPITTHFPNYRKSLKKRKNLRVRRLGMKKAKLWICYFLHSRSINITISKTWLKLQISLW